MDAKRSGRLGPPWKVKNHFLSLVLALKTRLVDFDWQDFWKGLAGNF